VIDAKNMDVEVSQSAVSIGEYGDEKHRRESFSALSFIMVSFNALFLPAPIQNDQVKAEFKDGILTLTMPKV